MKLGLVTLALSLSASQTIAGSLSEGVAIYIVASVKDRSHVFDDGEFQINEVPLFWKEYKRINSTPSTICGNAPNLNVWPSSFISIETEGAPQLEGGYWLYYFRAEPNAPIAAVDKGTCEGRGYVRHVRIVDEHSHMTTFHDICSGKWEEEYGDTSTHGLDCSIENERANQ